MSKRRNRDNDDGGMVSHDAIVKTPSIQSPSTSHDDLHDMKDGCGSIKKFIRNEQGGKIMLQPQQQPKRAKLGRNGRTSGISDIPLEDRQRREERHYNEEDNEDASTDDYEPLASRLNALSSSSSSEEEEHTSHRTRQVSNSSTFYAILPSSSSSTQSSCRAPPKIKLTPQQRLMLAENKKNHGNRGDPRMNKAVCEKLENPNLTLFQALTKGGFKFPCSEEDSTGRGPVYDEDKILLSQRKNQLSRRIRLLSKKSVKLMELRQRKMVQRYASHTHQRRQPKTQTQRQQQEQQQQQQYNSQSNYGIRNFGMMPNPYAAWHGHGHGHGYGHGYGHGCTMNNPYAPYAESTGFPRSFQTQHMHSNYNPYNSFQQQQQEQQHHEQHQQRAFLPQQHHQNNSIENVIRENQILREHLKKSNEIMFINQLHQKQFVTPYVVGGSPTYGSGNDIDRPTESANKQKTSKRGATELQQSMIQEQGQQITRGNVKTAVRHSPSVDEEEKQALINAGFKEDEITVELINEFKNKLEKAVHGKMLQSGE